MTKRSEMRSEIAQAVAAANEFFAAPAIAPLFVNPNLMPHTVAARCDMEAVATAVQAHAHVFALAQKITASHGDAIRADELNEIGRTAMKFGWVGDVLFTNAILNNTTFTTGRAKDACQEAKDAFRIARNVARLRVYGSQDEQRAAA